MSRVSNFDANDYNCTYVNGACNQTGRKRLLKPDGRHSQNTCLVLFVQSSWHLRLHGFTRWNHTERVTNLPLTTPALLSAFPETGCLPSKSSFYESMRWELYWPHIATDVYKTVYSCLKCSKVWVCLEKMRHLKVFPASQPLELFAIDNLGPWPKHRQETSSSLSSWTGLQK